MPTLEAHHRTIAAAVALNRRRTRYTITGVPGLVLDCHPDGQRSWVARYQVGRGREGRILRQERIGSLDERAPDYLSFAQAQKRCAELQVQARRDGRDPLAERRAPKPATFGDLFADWLEGHSKVHNKSWAAYEGLYRRHVEARLGSKAVGDITRTVVGDTLDDIARKKPLQSVKCQTLISSVFSWALDEGRVDHHPSVRLRRRHKETARERVMTEDELRRFWRALDAEPEHVARALRLLALTGCRLAEVVEAPKAEVDVTTGAWTLPGERTKNGRRHLLPLPQRAIELFRDAIKAADGSAFIFPAVRGEDGPFSKNQVSREFKRIADGIKIQGMRLHDLRHCAMTGMAALGVPLEIRQIVANQWTGRRQSVGSVYDQHDYLEEKRRALELWERRLLEIVEERPASGERW